MIDSLSRKKLIAGIFAPDKLLSESSLRRLSNLDDEELQFLKQLWATAGKERCLDIVARLVKLSKEDLHLDFSDIFVFCLNDSDDRIRACAVDGLAYEEGHQYVSPLLRLLDQDDSTQVRQSVIRALGKFALLAETGKLAGSYVQKIYLALLEVYSDKKTPMNLKYEALEAIAPYSMPRVKELIRNVYRSKEPGSKVSAIRAMGRNCDQVWLANLTAELDNDDVEIRRTAVVAIGEIGDERMFPRLLELIDDADLQVQEAAIMALVETGGENARETLEKMTTSSQTRIRKTAKTALKELDCYTDPHLLDS